MKTGGTRALTVAIVLGALASIGAGGALMLRAEARTSKDALASTAKPVTFVRARATTHRPTRAYVGTLHPWVEASIGPQLVSAYVDTVLVRPGSAVRRGDVLATLDCRHASTASTALAMQARALEARQRAIADEASRTQKLLDRGYASANEAEQVMALSAAEAAQLDAQKASLARSAVEVGDCVLRAPFDGEVGDRFMDPGAFVKPGSAIVSVVDRRTVRFAADVPENDFDVVKPDTHVLVHADAVNVQVEGVVARRAPHADADTRTVHFEVDIANASQSIPVDTTAEARIEFGETVDATELPLYAATVRGGRATLFAVVDGKARARTVAVVAETRGRLLVKRELEPGTAVVTEGRALLSDGDVVEGKEEVAGADGGAPKP